MASNLGNLLGNIIRDNANKASRPKGGGGGRPVVNIPAPPILSPVRNVSNAIGNAAQQYVPTATAYTPAPPQLTLGERIGQNIGNLAARPIETAARMPGSGFSVSTPAVNQFNIQDVVSRTKRAAEGATEWGVYDVDGVNVAMPSMVARRNNFELTSPRTTSDPAEVENLSSNHISYRNMPDEIANKITMPEQIGYGDVVREGAKAVKQMAGAKPKPEGAEDLIKFAEQATVGGLKQGTEILSDEWQAEHEFALVRRNSTGTTHLIPRTELRTATESGDFTTITNAVSRDEAKNISASGVLDTETGVIGGSDSVDSTLATAAIDARQMDEMGRAAAWNAARSGEVSVIDGKAYPVGTTAPTTVSLNPGLVPNGDLPLAPTGWIWVTNERPDGFPGDANANVWLEPYTLDGEGNVVVPEGMTTLRADDGPPAWLDVGTVLRPVGHGIGTGLGAGLDGIGWIANETQEITAPLIPQSVKDWWDENVQAPITWIINRPESDEVVRDTIGRIPIVGPILSDLWERPETKEAITVSLEAPITGGLTALGTGQRIVVNVAIEQQINAMRGGEMPDSAIEVGGLGLTQSMKHVPVLGDMFDWVEENPEIAYGLYDNGYDQDEDGTMDYYGADAVYNYFMDNEAPDGGLGILYRLIIETAYDPLTWIPIAGATGRIIGEAGTSIRMTPGAGTVTRGAGRALELGGRGVEVSARVAEDISDLGARHLLAGAGGLVTNPLRVSIRGRSVPLNPLGLLGQPTSSARQAEHASEAQAAINNPLGRKVTPFRLGGRGVFIPDGEGNVRLELAPESATETGPSARQQVPESQPVSDAELGKMADEAFGFEEGDQVSTRAGVFVRTGDGWEMETSGGETVRAETATEIPNTANQVPPEPGEIPKRWLQKPLKPDPTDSTYIDHMSKPAYGVLAEEMTPRWTDEVGAQAARGAGEGTPDHLKVSNVIAFETMEAAQRIDPTFQQEWITNHKNRQTGDPRYQLAEVFTRAPWPMARKYWGAMLGDGSTVPLKMGPAFRADNSTFRIDLLPARGATKWQIKKANDGVDAVWGRIKWHPEDLNNPEFIRIVQQAAELDYQLRERGLRYDRDMFDIGPITSVIPDDIPLPENVRAMAPYVDPTLRIEDTLPGEPMGRVMLDHNTDLGVDIYQVVREQVPPEWLGYWEREAPDLAGDEFYHRGDINSPSVETQTVFAPGEGLVIDVAAETAAARGLMPADRAAQSIDHIAAAEGVTPDTVPAPDVTAPPAATQAPASPLAEIRRLLDEMEGVQPADAVSFIVDETVPPRSPIEVVNAEQARMLQRQELTGAEIAPGMKMPELTGETRPDPTGTIEVPVRQVVDVADDAPISTASPQAKKVLDDVMDLEDGSPKLRALETKHKKPKPLERTNKVTIAEGDKKLMGHVLEDFEYEVLTEHPFPDGETLKDRLTRYFVEEGNKSGWNNSFDYYEDLAIEKVWPEYEAHLIENVYQRGVLPTSVKNAIKRLPQPVQDALEKAAMALRAPLRAYDGYLKYRRERTLFNIAKTLHFPSIQYFGNQGNALLSGDLRLMAYMANPKNAGRAYTLVKQGDPAKWWRETGFATPYQKMNQRLGMTGAPETTDILRPANYGNAGDALVGTKLLREHGGRAGNILANAAGWRWTRDFGSAMDAMNREGIGTFETIRIMKRQVLPDFRNQTINRMAEWGVEQPEAIRLWNEFYAMRGSYWEFNYNDIVAYYSPYIGRGRAERLGRDWNQVLNQTKKEVRKSIRGRAMAQPQTRADLIGQRMLAFHFFQSRQWIFMMRQAASHPFLINMYMNAQEELEKLSEGWPEFMQGWVKIFGTPFGRALFLNPMAMFSTYGIFEQEFTRWSDGEETTMGLGFTDWLDKWFGISPALADILNLAGMRGDIWAPDVLGINRESTLVTLAINTARSRGWLGDDRSPIGNVNTDLNSILREQVSSLNPIADDVEHRSSEQSMDREIRAIMVKHLEAQGIDPESAEGQAMIANAEMDTESDLYNGALKEWIAGEWFEQGARALLGPFRPRTRLADNEGGDLMTGLGENAKKLVNTPEPMVTIFRTQQDGFYDLGTDRDNGLAGIWVDIVYGTPVGNVTVDGVTYTRDEIMAMNTDQRKAVANGFLAERDALDEVHGLWDERDKFLAQPENREYAQYTQWQNGVRDYEGGADQYWLDLIKDNPTAEAYYNAFIKDEADPAARSRAMTNNKAFFSVIGWDSYVFDKPIEGYDSRAEVWDPLGIANTQPQPIPYEENNAEFNNEVRQVPVFNAEMQQYDTAFRNKAVAYGYPYGVNIPSMNSKHRQAIEKELDAEGIYEPKPSWQMDIYFDWIQKQPPGRLNGMSEAEVIDLFLKENQQEQYEKMPAQTAGNVQEAGTSAVPAPDPYGNTPVSSGDTFWPSVFDLINQHQHTRYKDPLVKP